MSDRDDGGQAFPLQKANGASSAGTSLRDYFAAKSLPVAWQAFEGGYFGDIEDESINLSVAKCAYQMADAMLSARKEQK